MGINSYFEKKTSIAPLVLFRICFGLMMLFGVLRFWSKGWIHSLYIEPTFHFSYYGFEFVQSPGISIYALFFIAGISALFIGLGLFYRLATVLFFLSFTYIELIDQATYLNHYYFISLVSFLLIFLPANRYFSLDVLRKNQGVVYEIPRWHIDSIKLILGLVYFYAGLAKINSDWLIQALPLKIWLPARNDMPFIGFLFNYKETAYLFSWLGCLYDLSLPFLLLHKRSRPYAYGAVIVFHLLTAALFPIGLFPHIMIGATLIFFPASFHQKIFDFIRRLFRVKTKLQATALVIKDRPVLRYFFLVFLLIQMLIPFRYLAYPGELFWTEEGYRFSWRVMLIEKTGYAQFTVKDSQGHQVKVNNTQFLTALQEKMMSTQADMILQYAHFLRDHYEKQGFQEAEVYVDSYVALNGRLGQVYIRPEVNLAAETESFKHKTWINTHYAQIQGF